jgi:hypothetical protein
MGSSVVPTPTTGTTSDNWVLISTVTPTAASSTVSFTGISGYRKLLYKTNGITQVTSGYTSITFNSDTGANYAWGSSKWDSTTYTNAYFSAATNINLFSGSASAGATITLILDSVNTNGLKTFTLAGFGASTAATGTYNNLQGLYTTTSPITSITLTTTTTFNAAGTLSLYGVAA